MNILICGNGKGSWQMRALQLGAALGARVTSAPADYDFEWCDVAVLVKKHAVTFAGMAHRAKKPVVWDALDFWSQPADNRSSEERARQLLVNQIQAITPALVIGATEAMTRAAGALCPSAYLPHHSWDGLVPTPPREIVRVVAYEGNELYLGRWAQWLKEACALRGWAFIVNPPNLAEADILVAFRDGVWDGWICREWKSGVKVVNAIMADRPLISQDSAAVRELNPDGSQIESRDQLDEALDFWTPIEKRRATRVHGAFDVDTIAARYREILATVGAPCTA